LKIEKKYGLDPNRHPSIGSDEKSSETMKMQENFINFHPNYI
jgi:hypothetical protein